jgi:hypothetical protein
MAGWPLAAEINALLTDCEVQLQPDGSPTEGTQLQRWPRHAPPPKRLRIQCSLQPLLVCLGNCMQHELAVHLLRSVGALNSAPAELGPAWHAQGNINCLGALTSLQSLSLQGLQLAAPGLSVVAQGCISLKQLQLHQIRMQAPPPPPPPQAPCSWPALVELQLGRVGQGVVSHVLPTRQAAPLLARLVAPKHILPQELQWTGVELQEGEEGQWLAEVDQLAAAVAPLAATLTHLSLFLRGEEAEAELVLSLCQALPQLRSLHLDSFAHPPYLSQLLQHRPPLSSLVWHSCTLPRRIWVSHLLLVR